MIHSGMVQFHTDLTQLLAPIDDVCQHPDNYNNGDLDKIIESIETNGMYRPIYVQKSSGYIIAGNHTWEACKTLGATEIPVVMLDVDDMTADRILVADNWIASKAEPDNALLLNVLDRINTRDSLRGTGLADHDLLAIRALAEIPPPWDDFAQWPLIAVRVPPHVRRAYNRMTEQAVGDRERFELLMRLAGWDGH